jgi:hypothetical protein
MHGSPMPIRALLLGISAEPNHAAVSALVEAADQSVWNKVFGCKTLQFSHAGQSTLASAWLVQLRIFYAFPT